MPKDTTSPFTPSLPVSVDFFVGRQPEIERLRQKMVNALGGRLEVAFVSGERGIGKSSLASYVRALCERRHDVVGVHAFMGGVSTVEEAVRRVFDRIVKEKASDATLLARLREFLGDHVREVDLFGLSLTFDANERELKRLANDFVPSLRRLLEKTYEASKGILLVLDDINGLAMSETFANWLKSLVDETSVTASGMRMCVVLVGLDDRRRSLIHLQPSLARILDVVDIAVWSPDETREFFQRTFAEAGMRCGKEALDALARFAGGLPMLAHEIGDATFAADTDGVIDASDAEKGILDAAEVVGRKHVDPLVLGSIKSKRYRTIVGKVAQEPFMERFTRSDVKAHLTDQETKVFDSFLAKMKQLGVVVEDPEGGRGSYRFKNHLHHLYLWMEALQAQRTRA